MVGATRDNLPPKKLDVSSNFHQILSNRKLEEWPETTFLVKNSTFPSISFKFHKSGDRISSPCFVGTKLGDEILPPLLCFKIDQNRPKSTKSGDGTLPPRLPESRCMGCSIFIATFGKWRRNLVGTVSSPLLKWRWKVQESGDTKVATSLVGTSL